MRFGDSWRGRECVVVSQGGVRRAVKNERKNEDGQSENSYRRDN